MDQQELITDIEELITFGDGIESLVKELMAFFEQPHTKVEIQSYVVERSLDKMFKKADLDRVMIRMLAGKSTFNSALFRESTFFSGCNEFTLSEEFMVKLKLFTNKLFDYLLEIKSEIDKMSYDDVVERDVALRRTVCKIKTIFNNNAVTPLDEENIREMDVEGGEDEEGYYMTVPFPALIEKAKGRVSDNFKYSMSTYDWTQRDRYSYVSANKLKTLKNLIMYLSTFLRY